MSLVGVGASNTAGVFIGRNQMFYGINRCQKLKPRIVCRHNVIYKSTVLVRCTFTVRLCVALRDPEKRCEISKKSWN